MRLDQTLRQCARNSYAEVWYATLEDTVLARNSDGQQPASIHQAIVCDVNAHVTMHNVLPAIA